MFYLTTHSTHFIYGYMASLLEQIQISDVAGENSRLQDKVRSIQDANHRTVRSMDSRVQTLQDDLDIVTSELKAVQAEYDSYKVTCLL